MRKVIIEFSLVEECKKVTENELIEEISDAFSKGDLTIPWCEKIENVSMRRV